MMVFAHPPNDTHCIITTTRQFNGLCVIVFHQFSFFKVWVLWGAATLLWDPQLGTYATRYGTVLLPEATADAWLWQLLRYAANLPAPASRKQKHAFEMMLPLFKNSSVQKCRLLVNEKCRDKRRLFYKFVFKMNGFKSYYFPNHLRVH